MEVRASKCSKFSKNSASNDDTCATFIHAAAFSVFVSVILWE